MPNFIKFFFFARSRWRNSNLPASSHTCSDERQHCKVQVFTPAHRVKEGTASVQVLFLASQTAGAAAQWDAVASRETFKIAWPLDEHRMKKYERGTVQRPDHTSRANNSHTPIQDVVGWMHSERRADGHWSGDLLIADWDDLEKNIASEVHVKRTESQDVQVTRADVTDHSSKRNT